MGITATNIKEADDRAQVYVLVENRLVRETLVRLFRKRSDLCVIAQGSSDQIDDVFLSQCDIVISDDLNTASELRLRIQERGRGTGALGVVLIDMKDDEEEFLEAVRSGVSGYLLNDASANDVVAAVRAVARGEVVCPPQLCRALFRWVAQFSREPMAQIKHASAPGLTIRQQQLVSLVARGLTNKEIASQLNLSEFTIKNHLHRIMRQVEAESRYDMVKAARAFGCVGLA